MTSSDCSEHIGDHPRRFLETPPVPKLLDGEQEAQVIALHLGRPPGALPERRPS